MCSSPTLGPPGFIGDIGEEGPEGFSYDGDPGTNVGTSLLGLGFSVSGLTNQALICLI